MSQKLFADKGGQDDGASLSGEESACQRRMTDLGMPRSLPGREQRRGQLRGLGRVSFRCGEAQSNFFSLSMGLGLPSRDFGRAIFPHG